MIDLSTIPSPTLAEYRHKLVCGAEEEKAAAKEAALKEIVENNYLHFYIKFCELFSWPTSSALQDTMRAHVSEQLAKLDAAIVDAEENLGESEVRDAFCKKAAYMCQTGDFDGAHTVFRVTLDKTLGISSKIEIYFAFMRMNLYYGDFRAKEAELARNIETVKEFIELGGDWERRNRLKIYEGCFLMQKRQLREACALFISALNTFSATELMSFREFVFYTVVLALFSLDRVSLKKKVIDSPEVLSVAIEWPLLRSYMNSFYACEYHEFFLAMTEVLPLMARSRFVHHHVKYYHGEIRVKTYNQCLASYKSMKLSSMSEIFGLSEEFLDKELSYFIWRQRVFCKIDKVDGIIYTTRPDARNAHYTSLIKDGDALLQRMTKLAARLD